MTAEPSSKSSLLGGASLPSSGLSGSIPAPLGSRGALSRLWHLFPGHLCLAVRPLERQSFCLLPLSTCSGCSPGNVLLLLLFGHATQHAGPQVPVKAVQSCLTLCNPHGLHSPWILQVTILEWANYPFSSGSSQPRNRTGVLCIAGGFFTN